MLREWFAMRSLKRLVRMTCRRHKISTAQLSDEQFDLFVDELLVRYQYVSGTSAFGDGVILQSLVEFARWLAEFVVANSDEILAIISFIIGLFEEQPT